VTCQASLLNDFFIKNEFPENPTPPRIAPYTAFFLFSPPPIFLAAYMATLSGIFSPSRDFAPVLKPTALCLRVLPLIYVLPPSGFCFSMLFIVLKTIRFSCL